MPRCDFVPDDRGGLWRPRLGLGGGRRGWGLHLQMGALRGWTWCFCEGRVLDVRVESGVMLGLVKFFSFWRHLVPLNVHQK